MSSGERVFRTASTCALALSCWFPGKVIPSVTLAVSGAVGPESTGEQAVTSRCPPLMLHFFRRLMVLMKASPPGRNVDYAAVWTTYKFLGSGPE